MTIYPYSLSTNLLKEVLLKMNLKFVLTNQITKANVILGLRKHVRKNLKLTKLANKFKIPIYTINCVNHYQLTRLFMKLS